MKHILILAVFVLMISISISISQQKKGIHSHQDPPKKHVIPAKEEKKCKSSERLSCKQGICFCFPKKKFDTSDLKDKFRNRERIYSSGDFDCKPGYRKCYNLLFKKYKCVSNLQKTICLHGPINNYLRHKK